MEERRGDAHLGSTCPVPPPPWLARRSMQGKAATADGTVTASEVWSILTRGVASLIQLANTMGAYTGAEKKEAVIKAVQRLYDEVIAPLDIPGIPNFLENTIVDPLIGRAVPIVLSGIIDGLVSIFNKEGNWIPTVPEGPAAPAPSDPTPNLPEGWEPY